MMTDEEKLEGLASSGRIHRDEPAPAADQGTDKKEETPTPPAPTVTTTQEDTPPAPQPTEPKTPADGKPAEPTTEGNTPSPSTTEHHEQSKKRQVRYIPIAKYQDDKKEWEKTEQALKDATARIAELEGGDRPAGAQKKAKEEIIKTFAEKYAIDEADVRDLLSTQEAGQSLPAELVETMQSMQREKVEREEQEHFNREWTPIEAQLKAKYPGATPEQLKQAKDTLDKLSHTEAFIDRELDYVAYKHAPEIDKLFAGAEKAPEDNTNLNPDPAPRRTVEGSRPAGSKTTLSAADFKGRQDFSEFNSMEQGAVKAIIKDMDPATYRSFIAWASKAESGGGTPVTRNGQRIVLK